MLNAHSTVWKTSSLGFTCSGNIHTFRRPLRPNYRHLHVHGLGASPCPTRPPPVSSPRVHNGFFDGSSSDLPDFRAR